MMFLISGYFVPRSVHNKGVVQYLKSRLTRLGLPFIFGSMRKGVGVPELVEFLKIEGGLC